MAGFKPPPPARDRPKGPVYNPSRRTPPPRKIYPWGTTDPRFASGASAAPKSAAPAATPATPPASPPSTASLPPDATYEQQIGALQRQRDTSIAGLKGQRATTLLDYGYNEGPSSQLTFDVNNPESRAAQLKKRYDQSRSGAGVNMAARGQLYAGSYQNAQDALNEQQLSSEDQLQKALISFLAGNSSAQASAGTDYELGATGASGDRVARAATNPLYSPTGGTEPGAAATGSVKTGLKTNQLGGSRYVLADGSSQQVVIRNGKRYRIGASGKPIPIP